MPWQDHEAREHVARTEAMLARLDALPDPAARAQAFGAVQALVELYGECLARIMRQVTESADGAPAAAIAGDELVSHLLLVHDLHPEPTQVRVRRALEEVPGAELLAVEPPAVRVRLTASGCGAAALRQAVEETVLRAAPEIDSVEVADSPAPALIPVESLFTPAGSTPPGSGR